MKYSIRKYQNPASPLKRDAVQSYVPKSKILPIKASNDYVFNMNNFGTPIFPQESQLLEQGELKTKLEQLKSNNKLTNQEKLQNYDKEQAKNTQNLNKALPVAPYLIPGLGPIMWAGKAVDVATSELSDGKYKTWGNMIDQKTGSGEFIGDLTNPGYYGATFPKLIGKGIKSTSKLALRKAEPYLMGNKNIPMMNKYKPVKSL